jgi:hypothetical protein
MKKAVLLLCLALGVPGPALADPFFFSTGTVLNNIAVATRPAAGGKFEIEAGDDFITTGPDTRITNATFTGLLTNPSFTGGIPTSSVNSITVEIYRVFPKDSNVARTSGPPTFSTSQVPTRVNSPSDVEFDGRTSPGNLTFTPTVLSASLTASNSIKPGGIHPTPGQATLGNGPVTGTEVQFNVTFTTPFDLPPDHYFFVPQVDVSGGEFLWLNASRPIDATGTPFPAGVTDLQSWTRDQFLDPDWLRVGTDIVDGTTPPTFNQAFTLQGVIVPEPTAHPQALSTASVPFADGRLVELSDSDRWPSPWNRPRVVLTFSVSAGRRACPRRCPTPTSCGSSCARLYRPSAPGRTPAPPPDRPTGSRSQPASRDRCPLL